eukprot:scaffold34593_cov179-Amphora_coffeaeformis.AAC.8
MDDKSFKPTTKGSGVADYFAILGVGDKLVWKHTQKEQYEEQAEQDVDEENEKIAEEERFLREIVDVTIVSIQETTAATTTSQLNTSMDGTNSQTSGYMGGGELSDIASRGSMAHPGIEQVASYQTETSSHHDALHNLPHSPSHSDATTMTSWRPPASILSSTLRPDPSGWTLVQKTRPAAVAGHVCLLNDDETDEEHLADITDRSDESKAVTKGPILWNKFHVWDANISWPSGLRNNLIQQQEGILQQLSQGPAPLKGLRRKVENTLRTWQKRVQRNKEPDVSSSQKFYLAYRRRQVMADDRPAVADARLLYMQLHRNLLPRSLTTSQQERKSEIKSVVAGLPGLAGQLLLDGVFQSQAKHPDLVEEDREERITVEAFLTVPEGYDEFAIPSEYCMIRDPRQTPTARRSRRASREAMRTVLVSHEDETVVSGSGAGVEAIDATSEASSSVPIDPESLLPRIVQIPGEAEEESNFCYIPILAVRRQRVGDEERYHEDAALVEMAITFYDGQGRVVPPDQTHDASDDDDDDETTFRVLGKTPWKAPPGQDPGSSGTKKIRHQFGAPALLLRKNTPFGFADAAFATRVLDRFPKQNYKGLPLPEEELPMFCYPTGCRLHRARYSDAPLAQYYGFVVKNERGDSIYVSCVSFMEPLTNSKLKQLAAMSEKRRHTSLPHRRFYQIQQTRNVKAKMPGHDNFESIESDESTVADSNCLLTGFDDMTTFENKTIALVGRYPFWTAFRKFLFHLHILSGSSSELPLERYISHLLLSVPLPKPGGPTVLIPLHAVSDPMILSMPPEKDFPLLDLTYKPLFACLEIRTVITIVLGMLALEKKIIVMSTRPSLVLDVCELLRSLLFPFDLCAPYVPRLTEPFKTSLDFPGAIFVGIHDDGSPIGLAATVRKELPEDGIVVDLDTGEIDTFHDRAAVVKATWDILPKTARKDLISELQALCGDAAIVDGQEALDSQFDSAFDVGLTEVTGFADLGVSQAKTKEPLDDRAIRDSFLRFFCNVLGGYERYLVVPDADFLVSGDEWFDAQGFLGQVSNEKRPYLSSLVGTQLFQSFIQKRTEASDMHCLLFDECIAEYHASPKPYGRLGEDMESIDCEDSEQPRMMYSLLVDQSAAFPVSYDQSALSTNRSFDASDADGSFAGPKTSFSFAEGIKDAESAVNGVGDLITAPGRSGLPEDKRYIYCIDGNQCFPHTLNESYFLPKSPESWVIELPKAQDPLLARSERELEDAERRRRMATSQRGFQKQRRCLWQLPKIMGSHFLGAWLLCIPAQVSQDYLSHEQQSRYLLRALGAIRLFRSKQRIVPDEAAYRALMVACGRSKSDRRVELVKLFGLLRSDGIFPSAVTLGQYTKALAEGYSKRSSGTTGDDDYGVEVTESASRIGRLSIASLNDKTISEFESSLLSIDGALNLLEEHGKRWRLKHGADRRAAQAYAENEEKKKKHGRTWLPVVYSSSFAPFISRNRHSQTNHTVRVVAMWSRTRSCRGCAYIPLEEEVQAGWDVVGGEDELAGAVACPKCGALIVPMLGTREFSLEEALSLSTDTAQGNTGGSSADFSSLPPQITPIVSETTMNGEIQYVAYRSPASVRSDLERYVEDHGEEILDRDRLRQQDPELFYNFWWYCARFSVPLPLTVSARDDSSAFHYVAFASWERLLAERGCNSAAKVLSPLVQTGEAPASFSSEGHPDPFDDYPLLSHFNLQGYFATVWDHEDLSKLLVVLVEACDKRDFKAVVDCAIKCNKRRMEQFNASNDEGGSEVNYAGELIASQDNGGSTSCELDVYRTILYLAKYQCTSAFHAFFPATVKACKGYHFWCSTGSPSPIFDRLLREGIRRLGKEQSMVTTMNDVSDVALGFRCVFGHII